MNGIYKTVGHLNASLVGDRTIRVERDFNAPRQLVWDAHTVPALIRRWLLGPPGWTMPVCEVDLRVGGSFRYEWHNANGKAMGLSGTYTAIEAPHIIADTQVFDDDWTDGAADTRITLTEAGGITRLVLDITYATPATRDLVVTTPMLEGMEAGYERLDGFKVEGAA